MKFHKTCKAYRTTYSYEFVDKYGNKKRVTIYPGKDGVTELDIKALHYKDDYEVERNIANSKPPLSDQEKQTIENWKANYIRNIQIKYDYTPCNADVWQEIRNRFPANWNISLDEAEKIFDDKSPIFTNETKIKDIQAQEAVHDRISFLLKDLSDRDKEIYERVLLKNETKISVAADLGISDSYVSRIANQIKEKLASDKFLQKFFSFSSDLPKNDRLNGKGGIHR